MMDVGPSGPDNKRLKTSSTTWTPDHHNRQLPPPQAQPPYSHQHNPPYSRPNEPPHLLDRRHSEHAQYDHQRPNSGPSHSYGPPPPPLSAPSAPQGYPRPPPPQEPMVKRDPSDEPPQQLYRPPSGNGAEYNVNPNVPPHHEGPSRPVLPPFDQRGSYPQQQAIYPPTPSPMSATEPYNLPYGTTGLPPPPRDVNLYGSVSYPPNSTQRQQPDVRKKAQRAAQACDSCRTLKAKCDEGRPSCTSCKEKGMECRYRDPPPKQQDKVSADILEHLARVEQSFSRQFDQLNGRIAELQNSIRRPIPDTAPKEEYDEHVRMPGVSYTSHSTESESHHLPSNESPYSATTPGLQKPLDMPESARPREEVSEDDDSGDPGPQKAPSIPVNHTTGAARLLKVGPIWAMVQDSPHMSHRHKSRAEKYPIYQEEKRGLLRLFGKGEGYDNLPGYDRDPLTDHGDSTPGDTASNASSPVPAGEEWGQVGGLTPPGSQPDLPRGGISAEGMPDFSRETVETLVKSYMDHMNIMHPILIPSRFNKVVEIFLQSIPASHAKPLHSSAVLQGQGRGPSATYVGRNPESPSNKRKRSPALNSDYPTQSPEVINEQLKPGHPFRNIGSALVMLVMALGKICQHGGKIPGPVSDDKGEASHVSSPVVRNGHPASPLQNSPSLSTPGMASPQETDYRANPRSRRTSLESGLGAKSVSGFKIKNLDVIPGLAYFALATDVLGNQLAGNTLQHVHANILAGLYHGQLGRVMESHGFIAAGCRSLQVILRPKLDRFRKVKMTGSIPSGEDNPLLFAFWTCLQLESDIVAELPCPHSGILTYEEDMPVPNYQAAMVDDGIARDVIESYSAQLFLRKHLNSLHNMFYKPDGDENQFPKVVVKPSDHFPTIEACQENLNTIKLFAPLFAWDAEQGEPATTILGARLRAKYYGAQVITFRHFVLKILEMSSKGGDNVSEEFKANISAPAIGDLKELDFKVMQFARNGIKALINSTRAFHGLGDPGSERIIVTNVWGTAHAQWGNMLTLSAAYANPTLSRLVLEFVDKNILEDLLQKTLQFLSLTATPTSALAIDKDLLSLVGRKVGLSVTSGQASTSFSSSISGDIRMAGQY